MQPHELPQPWTTHHLKGEIVRKLFTVANTYAVKEAGIIREDDDTFCLPFVVAAEVLAVASPAVDKTLVHLDAALDKLLKVHPQFDVAVRELAKM